MLKQPRTKKVEKMSQAGQGNTSNDTVSSAM
jgi:hypothetical protein